MIIIIVNALIVTIIAEHKYHNCSTFCDLVFRKACRRLLYYRVVLTPVKVFLMTIVSNKQ
jgi:hypothetical protein